MRKITKNVQYKQAFSIKSDVNVFFFSDNLPKPLKKLNFGKLLDWITCFYAETMTRCSTRIMLVNTYGILQNKHSGIVNDEVLLDDLFE